MRWLDGITDSGGLAYCRTWGLKGLDTTEQLIYFIIFTSTCVDNEIKLGPAGSNSLVKTGQLLK